MSFTPFARFRNFTLGNLKALLEVYPDMEKKLSWSEAQNYAEGKVKGYKKTAYQQACQFGLEDRAAGSFRIHNYLYTFDDENLNRYLVFWFKTYFAPNPYVNSSDEPILIYCKLGDKILSSPNYSVGFDDFVEKNIGGKSDDILLNAIKAFAAPIKYKKDISGDILYIENSDVDTLEKEMRFIVQNFPIENSKSEKEFFERYSYSNFCKFYGQTANPDMKDGESVSVTDFNKVELPFDQSKECARKIVDFIYNEDAFARIKCEFEDNDKSIKINTKELNGNYLRYIFAKPSSTNYVNLTTGKTRVFTDKSYRIELNGISEECRLSTEWVSSELGDNGTSANYLRALIAKVNSCYKGMISIVEESGKWYLVSLVQNFSLSRLPELFRNSFAERYVTSLIAKPFVILTGNSGTGKTMISKQFAEYLEESTNDGEKNWVLVPVGADWTDNTKILGFYNPLADQGKGRYEKTEILKLIEEANKEENNSKPYFIILDEMNLSHVERYFSDFLSHMETPGLPFVLDGCSCEVKYPDNIFIVGTVNIDETTYMFSPKVLDRANVIEFCPPQNGVLDLFLHSVNTDNVAAANDGTAEAFLKLSREIQAGKCGLNDDKLNEMRNLFEQIYQITKKSGYEFAYRTVKEVRQYVSAAYEISEDKDNFNLRQAEDEQLLQKILPKIHGNKKEIGQLLEELGEFCTNNGLTLSSEKVGQMKGKLAQVQYASFI